jgi:hypothetical protein
MSTRGKKDRKKEKRNEGKIKEKKEGKNEDRNTEISDSGIRRSCVKATGKIWVPKSPRVHISYIIRVNK